MVDSPVVSFRSMSVRYGRFEAIRRLSFDLLADFGVVGLFGPNGAYGKAAPDPGQPLRLAVHAQCPAEKGKT